MYLRKFAIHWKRGFLKIVDDGAKIGEIVNIGSNKPKLHRVIGREVVQKIMDPVFSAFDSASVQYRAFILKISKYILLMFKTR